MAATYQVKVVSRVSPFTVITTIPNDKVNVEKVRWELNGIGSASFSMGVFESQATDVTLLTREVQIWRTNAGGTPVLIWWGIPVRSSADTERVTFQCVGLLWHFARRYFGPVEQQFLLNENFDDTTNWTATGGPTFTVDADYRIRGPKTAKLVDADEAQDSYITQTFTAPLNATNGTTFTIAAWYQLVDFVGPAFGDRGLMVIQWDGPTLVSQYFQPITNAAPVGDWQRLEVISGVNPAGEQHDFEVRLYAPGGTIRWGATSATTGEHLQFPAGTDVADILTDILEYAQTGGETKSDLTILVDTPATGTTAQRDYFYEDHGNILQALMEWPEEDICDIEIVWNTAGTTRTFTSYAPRKGSYRSGLPLNSTNIVGIRSDVDGTQTSTSVRVLGTGDGPDREIGFAMDATDLDDLVFEAVQTAPQETPIDALDTLAEAELARAKTAVKIPSISVRSDAVTEGLFVGDTVPVTVDWGYIQIATVDYRVVTLELDPPTEILTVGLQVP